MKEYMFLFSCFYQWIKQQKFLINNYKYNKKYI